jgi:ATP-dependent RNA helicase HelY
VVRANRAELIAHYAFPLDSFQLRAMDALDDGESVLVAAPTGSGKTVVAEYAIDAALAVNRRAFYTAPIKALSNQKYHDLATRLGSHQVGLLTGDNSINGDAPVVVMTTEVLRNMIYAKSPALRDLDVVVLDEVHFLQDTYRGPVWEEVIIHLPPHVRLVCLSATVSNSDEVTEWIRTVRGPTTAVLEERRPVQLDNLFLIGDATHDRLHLVPTLVQGRPNHEASRIDAEGHRPGRGTTRRKGAPGARRKLYTPSRMAVLDLLEDRGLLPAIMFIFSRNQCDAAAEACVAAGVRLTTGEERERIREIVDARLEGIELTDLAVLGYSQFLAQLEAGVAAHHAGMVPPFKEVVEACFAEGLVKMVFATETLAVGINMPAKTVVIEKLTKFTGDHHAFLTPGEYTQLTGRAGRRGLDEHGNALVLWSPFVPFDQVAALASSRTFHLNSAFRPTYNMAANLVRSFSSERAHHLLNLSFAQFQADRDVVKIEARLERRRQQLDELVELSTSPFGDLEEYRRALRLSERSSTTGVVGRDDLISLAMMKLKPGDVIYADKGRYSGRIAILSSAHRKGGLRLNGITSRRDLVILTAVDFDEPPRALGKIELPELSHNRSEYLRDVVNRLDRVELEAHTRRRRDPDEYDITTTHPVEADPQLADRMKAAAQAERLTREINEMRQRVRGRSQSIARDFDRVLALLSSWDYVDGWTLTDAGKILARTFHECDLLIVESLRRGLLDDLDPASLAGLVSVFVYEHRSPEQPPEPWFPSALVRRRWQGIATVSYELQDLEEQSGLSVHRPPDATFLAIAYAWAAGEGFAEVVEAEDLTGGDFVRTTKQLIDVLRQLALVAPLKATRASAEQAAERLFRGVVAASSSVETFDTDPAPAANEAGSAEPATLDAS